MGDAPAALAHAHVGHELAKVAHRPAQLGKGEEVGVGEADGLVGGRRKPCIQPIVSGLESCADSSGAVCARAPADTVKVTARVSADASMGFIRSSSVSSTLQPEWLHEACRSAQQQLVVVNLLPAHLLEHVEQVMNIEPLALLARHIEHHRP